MLLVFLISAWLRPVLIARSLPQLLIRSRSKKHNSECRPTVYHSYLPRALQTQYCSANSESSRHSFKDTSLGGLFDKLVSLCALVLDRKSRCEAYLRPSDDEQSLSSNLVHVEDVLDKRIETIRSHSRYFKSFWRIIEIWLGHTSHDCVQSLGAGYSVV
jgi:hypothetical protein